MGSSFFVRFYVLWSLRQGSPLEQGGESQRSVLPQHVNPLGLGGLKAIAGVEKIFSRFLEWHPPHERSMESCCVRKKNSVIVPQSKHLYS